MITYRDGSKPAVHPSAHPGPKPDRQGRQCLKPGAEACIHSAVGVSWGALRKGSSVPSALIRRLCRAWRCCATSPDSVATAPVCQQAAAAPVQRRRGERCSAAHTHLCGFQSRQGCRGSRPRRVWGAAARGGVTLLIHLSTWVDNIEHYMCAKGRNPMQRHQEDVTILMFGKAIWACNVKGCHKWCQTIPNGNGWPARMPLRSPSGERWGGLARHGAAVKAAPPAGGGGGAGASVPLGAAACWQIWACAAITNIQWPSWPSSAAAARRGRDGSGRVHIVV